MKLSAALTFVLFIGVNSPALSENRTYDHYHKISIDNPRAQVLVDSRFQLLLERDTGQGRLWLYTDYQGRQDQEFVFVYAGKDEEVNWPPAEMEKMGSPIGTIYESYGGIELSQLGIDQIAQSRRQSHPACGLSRVWTHRNTADTYLTLIYIEGAPCAAAFAPPDSIGKLSEMLVKNRARAVIKLQAR